MSDLPDLDTTQIGFIAYYNAIDQGGVSSITPDEVLSSSLITSQTLYDNGVEGTFELPNTQGRAAQGREGTFRVKNDGFIVTFIDRTNDFTQKTGSPVRGYWDMAVNINKASGDTGKVVPSIGPSTLEQGLNSLRQELSNSPSMDFSFADVGVYNYEFPGATTLTVLGDGIDASATSASPAFSYTSSTSLDYVAAHSAIHFQADRSSSANFEGVTLAAGSATSPSSEYGAVDALSQGLVPSSGTEYNHNFSRSKIISTNVSGTVTALFS